MNSDDIIKKSDSKSLNKSKTERMQARLYKVDFNKIIYTVSSSNHDKQYLVTVQLLDLASDRLKSLRDALSGSIKISCTCPAFAYRGYKYINYKAGTGIDKETRSPDITNPNKEGMACKHILVALNQMKSDYDKIYKLIQDTTPAEKPVSPTKNSDSSTPTEKDIEIIDEFQNACSKLYKEFSDYEDSGENAPFKNSKFYTGSDPSKLLLDLSKPVSKSLNGKYIGKLKSLDDILKFMGLQKNGFNVLLDSDVKALTRKLNSVIKSKTESLINNIILNLIGD